MRSMYLLLTIGLAILFRSIFEILVSRTGGKLDDNLSNTVVNIAATITALVPLIYLKTKNVITIPTTTSGLVLSISAGIAVGIFTLFLIESYAKGGLVYTTPLIYGGTIILASLVGVFFLKESITFFEILGISVILLGVGIVIYSRAAGV